ncbi:MAG: hypothetical protein H7A47_12295 [Verrucomicrobiales bacterium]|nr:hypothetical protein [Verrucomicrobiales bacterium]
MAEQRNPKRSRLAGILASLIVFVIAYTVLDFGIGHFACARKLERVKEEIRKEQDMSVEGGHGLRSLVFHHGMRANYDGTAEWGDRTYHLRTDSLGFKDRECREISLTNSAGSLLFLGDSFTEGIGVEASSNFVGCIEATLRNGSPDIQVLNAGVSSYSPKLCLLKAVHYRENVGLHFDEVWIFPDCSDVQDEMIYGAFAPAGLTNSPPLFPAIRFDPLPNNPGFFQRSLTYRTLCRLTTGNDPWHRRRYRLAGSEILLDYWVRDAWLWNSTAYESWGRTGLESARFHMKELVGYLRRLGVRVGLGVYPWPDEILRWRGRSLHEDFWREFAKAMDVPLLDLYPAFLSGEPKETVRRFFIKGDVHWNEEGHGLVAAQWLKFRESLTNWPALTALLVPRALPQ